MKKIAVPLLICLFSCNALFAQSLIGKWQFEKFSGDTAVISNIERSSKSDNNVNYELKYLCDKNLFGTILRDLQRTIENPGETVTLEFLNDSKFTLPKGDHDNGTVITYSYKTLDKVLNIGDGAHEYEVGGKTYTKVYKHNELNNFTVIKDQLIITILCGTRALNIQFKKAG